MNIDSQEFQTGGMTTLGVTTLGVTTLGRTAKEISDSIDADIDSWAASEAASSNTKSGTSANWLDSATKWTTTAADLFTKYTASKTPSVPQGNVTPPQSSPIWLLPVGLGATALILMLAFNNKKD